MKGIVLAGGLGTRLYPMSSVINKQLLPIYDKPMIYYPIATLMLAGIREILIISTPKEISKYQTILGNGKRIGVKFSYIMEKKPKGIAQAFILGERFIGTDNVCFILGDNLFYGYELTRILAKARRIKNGAVIFGYWVKNPARYGVIEFDAHGKPAGIEEKPQSPKSHYAVPGLYFYDNQVIEIAKNIKPSSRGELEITDVNMQYLKEGKLRVELISRGIAWFDTGTPESLLDASNFVATIEKKWGMKIACLEEVAFRKGFINKKQLKKVILDLPNSSYKDYLLRNISS